MSVIELTIRNGYNVWLLIIEKLFVHKCLKLHNKELEWLKVYGHVVHDGDDWWLIELKIDLKIIIYLTPQHFCKENKIQ